MKVCIVTPHTRISGGTRVLFSLAETLYNNNIDVTMLSLRGQPQAWVGKLPYKFVRASRFNRYSIPDCDIVIDFLDNKPYTSAFPKGVKHVLYLQGFGTQSQGLEHANLNYGYDAVVTTSSWLRELALRAGHANVSLIPPGIDPMFKKLDGVRTSHENVIGSLYHDSPEKNSDMFLLAMNKLSGVVENCRSLLLSAKRPVNNLELFEQALVPYSLFIDPPQHMLPVIYNTASVWVSTSLNEGFGLPILEAMACGVPTVVVPSFGLDDYLEHQNNCFIVENSKESIARGIEVLVKDVGMRKRIINSGFKLASKFTWKNTVSGFIKLFEQVL